MLKQRLITGLFLLAFIFLALFFVPSTVFTLLIALIGFACAWEWANLATLTSKSAKAIYAVVFVVLALGITSVGFISGTAFLIWTVAIWLLMAVFVVFYPQSARFWGRGAPIRLVLGMLTLLPAMVALLIIYRSFGPLVLLFAMSIVWCADSGAYFAGKAFGRHRLLPKVSPGKTWQGLLGGLACAAVFSLLAFTLYWQNLAWYQSLGLSVIVALFSVLGDFAESMLKRECGVKDSGRLLPGHGGVLDRLDGMIAALPIFLLLLQYLL